MENRNEVLKYTIISSQRQYRSYCNALEQLVFAKTKDKHAKDEIALLTLLIEKWDAEQTMNTDFDPIELLRSLMIDHGLKPSDMVAVLGIGKGYISDILHYKKGLSKEVIRKLASYFKVAQEAFNRPYNLIASENAHLKNARVMNTKKKLAVD